MSAPDWSDPNRTPRNEGHERSEAYRIERNSAAWVAGFAHGAARGKLRNNPFNGIEDRETWQSWTDGYRYGRASIT